MWNKHERTELMNMPSNGMKAYSWLKLGEVNGSVIRAYDEYDAAIKAAIECGIKADDDDMITFEIRDDREETIHKWNIWAEMVYPVKGIE